MFSSIKARECLRGVIGWKDHYDPAEVAPLTDTDLLVSESGEFYQEKHPAMRLDLISASLPSNRDLNEYLKEVEEGAITELLNDISVTKELSRVGKEIVGNDVIFNAIGYIGDTITNEGRFVGIKINPTQKIGLKVVLNRIGLQFTQAQTNFKLYLYHTSQVDPLKEFTFANTLGGKFHWEEVQFDIKADDKEITGGEYFLGYYQDDLSGNAVHYDKLNWRTGFCSACDGGIKQGIYSGIQRFVGMRAFYLPASDIDSNRKMFNPDNVIYSDTNNWGMNMNVSVRCDLTNFWCDNRMTMKNILGLKVTHKILKDISFSQQMNHVEERLKMMIIRDLEGDKETNYINIADQYKRALKAIKYSHSSINSICLPCDKASSVTYGMM